MKPFEYVFIGGGPAGLCGLAAVLARGVPAQHIKWIDQGGFKAGDFGTLLSVGSSLPGNTRVSSYRYVNQAIYQLLPQLAPLKTFLLDSYHDNDHCSLSIAAEPMLDLSNKLRDCVDTQEAKVIEIKETAKGLYLTLQSKDGKQESLYTRRCILATGAKPKTLKLPSTYAHLKIIDPTTSFIQTSLASYIDTQTDINQVAVFGSSHSAALAVMQLLSAGLSVKQFMNKTYRFAEAALTTEGIAYTRFDNTGLKAGVAAFTRQLSDLTREKSPFQNRYQCYISQNKEEAEIFMAKHLKDCSHAVFTVGYEPSPTLTINQRCLSRFNYDTKTSAFTEIKGLFGMGIAFPQEIISPAGDREFAVGYSKFWRTVNDNAVRETWENGQAAIL